MEISHEGTNVIEVPKLRKVTTDFENLLMSGDEFFDGFSLS